MQFTNRYKLPAAIVSAVTNDPYTKGDSDFSITELLKPSRQWALQKQFKDKIVEDVADRLWALYGQVAHLILERANVIDIAEKRFSAIVDGKKISGQIDSLSIEDDILSDYKFSSAWNFRTTKAKPEHIAQLNMQRYILNKNGIYPQKLQIIGLLRDFSLTKSEKELTYPKSPVVIQPIPMWSADEIEVFMKDRIRSHTKAIEELPQCSKEDLWGGKRCQSYCSVSSFCSQYNKKIA